MAVPAVKLPGGQPPSAARYPRLVHDGGGPPSGSQGRAVVSNGAIGMALFLGTETMLFAALISAYLILRAASDNWPPLGQPRLPVAVTGLNTLVLLASAVTMRCATIAGGKHETDRANTWLSVTVLLGVAFLIVQGTEWSRLLHYGLNASSSTFGATFYTLIGCHATHVLAAVLTLLVIRFRLRRGGRFSHIRHGTLETVELYWLFVVAVWPILYVLVYWM